MARNIHVSSLKDLIVAPATGAGAAAIAIVRLSGAGAIHAGNLLFSGNLQNTTPGQMTLGKLQHPEDGEPIDQCLAVLWRAPRSYTGEDMVEFHLHGSPALVRASIEACQFAGARLADPGEFTRRAFLNGKLDLAQAEAVATLTNSQTEAASRSALSQLQGGLSQQLGKVRQDLVQVTAELEANVDYPEEEIPELERERLATLVDRSQQAIANLLASYERGRRLMRGALVVFAGPPNAGKSSLFNALLKRERAIVTPHPGTTRDTIEATVDLHGIPLTFVDTAGLREQAEEIEALGIQRTRDQIEAANLILFIVDVNDELENPMREYERIRSLPHLVIFNKCDVKPRKQEVQQFENIFQGKGRKGQLFVSVLKKEGLDKIEKALVMHLGAEESEGGETNVITSARHEKALRLASDSLSTVIEGLASDLSPEFIVVDLATALSEIDTITGRGELDEDILDTIFSTFCLGK